ncbi:unnamed protein product [Arctia plantaginis]|uniref:Uncharacterized protein n=1 Tax=Arctia plantaginis TaxID=874455 RepID=A0A8S0Z4N2_ARCPL|nr:unnamed protein product [Arctia plantaginis]
MTISDEDKSKFYEDLSLVPKSDKIILLSDFNSRVSAEYGSWRNVLGRHGVGGCNSNGLLLLSQSQHN